MFLFFFLFEFGCKITHLFFICNRINRFFLFFDDFLGSDLIVIKESQYIDSVGFLNGDAGFAVDGPAAEDAAGEVDDLEDGFSFVVDDPFAAVEGGEVVGVAIGVEHQEEAAFVIAGARLEGIVRGLQ